MNKACLFAIPALSLALSACGADEGDRALSGGAIGAGTGALVGGPAGALIGGGAGAAAGAMTEPDDVDLGEPVWE